MLLTQELLDEISSNDAQSTSLVLQKQGIDAEKIKRLIQALKHNHTVTLLDLGHNSLADAGFKALMVAMKKNTSITSLDLSYNKISCTPIPFKWRPLYQALLGSFPLTNLCLRGNKLGFAFANVLAYVLPRKHVLRTLDLSHNEIDDASISALAGGLSKNKSLTNLNLSHNKICNKVWGYYHASVESLVKAIEHTRTVISLDLSHNQIESSAARACIEAIQSRQYFCSSLEDSSRLLKINLSDNGIYSWIMEEMNQVMISNHQLELKLAAALTYQRNESIDQSAAISYLEPEDESSDLFDDSSELDDFTAQCIKQER